MVDDEDEDGDGDDDEDGIEKHDDDDRCWSKVINDNLW